MPHTNSGIGWEKHGQGPLTLVMLPGFGASADQMTGIARHLAGFRVVIFDVPGHRLSVRAPADGRLPTLGAALHDAIHDAGVDAYCLVGFPLAVRSRCVSRLTTRTRCVRWVVSFRGTPRGRLPGTRLSRASMPRTAMSRPSRKEWQQSPWTRRRPRPDQQHADRHRADVAWHGWLAGGALTSQANEPSEVRVPTCYLLGGKDVA